MKYVRLKNLLLFLITIFIEIFILYSKNSFIRGYLGDVLFIFVLYFFINIFLAEKLKFLSIYIFLLCTFVEFLQYIDIIKILGLENITFLKILIGTTFDFKDIICYFIGGLILLIYDMIFLKRRKHSEIYRKR